VYFVQVVFVRFRAPLQQMKMPMHEISEIGIVETIQNKSIKYIPLKESVLVFTQQIKIH
jgi:hypothetical protein